MKYYILKEIVAHLSKYKDTKLNNIQRISNNTVSIGFNDRRLFYFDLTKSNSTIYITNKEKFIIQKEMNSPFDVALKQLSNSTIKDIYLHNDDKILNIKLEKKLSYKSIFYTISMEFTGKNTNIILLDDKNTTIEALRHIDKTISTRVVLPCVPLEELKKPDIVYKIQEIEDIQALLLENYLQIEQQKLKSLKQNKLSSLDKQIKKLQVILDKILNTQNLEELSSKYQHEATILLANIDKIRPFDKTFTAQIGEETTKIKIIKQFTKPSMYINYLFAMSKKLKQKLKNQHIEIENLQSKLTYTIRLRTLIDDCTTTQDINLLFPSSKQTKTNKKDKLQLFQTFYIDGFKIILGKNEKENIAVLKSAKSNNMWFHLKDISSSHIVVVSQKEKLPQHIIEYAAKLCVSFSCDQKGTYIVDYTQRKYVRIQRKANTIYTHNKSISVKF